MQKMKKKMLSLHLLQQKFFFYSEMVWYFIRVYNVYVVVQIYPWFKFYFPLFWGMVMYDNEFETKENKI